MHELVHNENVWATLSTRANRSQHARIVYGPYSCLWSTVSYWPAPSSSWCSREHGLLTGLEADHVSTYVTTTSHGALGTLVIHRMSIFRVVLSLLCADGRYKQLLGWSGPIYRIPPCDEDARLLHTVASEIFGMGSGRRCRLICPLSFIISNRIHRCIYTDVGALYFAFRRPLTLSSHLPRVPRYCFTIQ